MFKSMHERLSQIATEDNDREDRIGVACPIRLDLWLSGGHTLTNVALVDGENSLDDHSIDVRSRSALPTDNETFTVAIAHIVAFRHVWPEEAEEQHALRAGRASPSKTVRSAK